VDLTEFDALSFDCYGTLIDWETGIMAVLDPIARRDNPSLTDEALLGAFAKAEGEVEAANPAMLYSDVLKESLRRVGAALAFDVTEADTEAFGNSVGNWPAFPDSAEALQRLKQRYKLIILSNVHRDGFAGSNKRLQVEFDAILTAQDIGSYKPSAANFNALLAETQELGVLRGRLLHVAQSLFHDHIPAKRVGLPTVWINRRHDQGGWGATPDPGVAVIPYLEFPSMAALADAVDAAFAASH